MNTHTPRIDLVSHAGDAGIRIDGLHMERLVSGYLETMYDFANVAERDDYIRTAIADDYVVVHDTRDAITPATITPAPGDAPTFVVPDHFADDDTPPTRIAALVANVADFVAPVAGYVADVRIAPNLAYVITRDDANAYACVTRITLDADNGALFEIAEGYDNVAGALADDAFEVA